MDISKLKGKDWEAAELIGIDKYALLVSKYGGGRLYIPTLFSLMRNENVAAIKQQYNSRNAADLGKKYGVSIHTIVRIATKNLGIKLMFFFVCKITILCILHKK